MERKRELTSVDIAALVGELGDYTGAKVDKAYLYPDDLVRLRMRHFEHGRVELLLAVGDVKHLHAADPSTVPDAPQRPPNFAKMLRNRLAGADFADLEQHGFDRVVTFVFERGDEHVRLVVELFGEGNVVVCDGTGQIVDSLRTLRLRSRTVVPGAQYEYPEGQSNPFALTREQFDESVRSSEADVVRTLATRVNLGGQYAEEVCARAGVEKSLPIEEADDGTTERLYESLSAIGGLITDRRFEPRVYYRDDTRIDVAPLSLEALSSHEAEQFDSFNAAVEDYFTHFDVAEDTDEADVPGVAEEIERKERIIDQQTAAIERFQDEAAEQRERAESVYAHYELVDEVISTIRGAREADHAWDDIEERLQSAAETGNAQATAIRRIDPDRGMVSLELDEYVVDLDIATGVEKNADRLYTEAKEIEEKREGAEAALAETREELDALKQRKEEGRGEENAKPPVGETPWRSRSSIPVRSSEEWYERFRWFHTSEGFLVIGGRNADQNEELVSKYVEPHDRFFHAQAHGGPVTILKASGPSERSTAVEFPERTRQQAAQFAISYSSVWKSGQFSGEAYAVTPDQVSKTAESGEYLQKGEFVIRGEREYFDSVPVGVAIGVQCEPVTRVIGGPPEAVRERSEVAVQVEPGNVAQSDVAKRIYRIFREAFTDTSFVRKVGSPDLIQEFLPPGRSTIIDR